MENYLLTRTKNTTIVIAIVALLALAQQLKAQTKYDFAIAGTWVTSENCNDLTVIPGVEGSVKYDAENKTLFLKNAKIDGGNANAIYSTLEGLTIRVAGKNQMRSDFTSTIQFTQPMQIAGSGTLNVENTQGDAIYANATSLIIDACTLNARGLNYGIVGEDGKNNEKLTIKYATVTAEGKNIASIGCFKYLTLMGCKISQPTDVDFDEELGGIGKDGKLLKDPITITPTTYQIWIAGKLITLDNCNDLTTIPGVEGTVKFDPATRILTLENANISTNAHYGILNFMDNVTIQLVGTNNITAQLSNTIYNNDDCSLSVVGPNATLNLHGAIEAKDKASRQAFQNHGSVIISQCTIEANAGVNGFSFGEWKFDRCNIKVKGNGDDKYPFAGSMAYFTRIPLLEGCALKVPTGTHWKEFTDQYGTCYSLVDGSEKAITDWITITTDPAYIDKHTIRTTKTTQNIYSIGGARLSTELNRLPKGLYIINGRIVAKP